ncbi:MULTISPECIES: YveK family protein [Priestia]|uniref:YveK family protein n=1 Tax=Priestia TaxID=2800373 RepID=UPI00177D83C7|nr:MULTISPECIES: Wzz/FepE/Etk N-terminal domain-containing protein [Priestia]MBD8845743.1 capsular biosynthesis protein [Priestia megaterium]QTL50596.1 capsular biosynthesis protein [Priestia aryabhattai]
MGETISIKELFQTLKKRIWLIALITIIAAIISAVISFFVLTPVYESKTQILVNQAKSDQQLYNATEVQTNIQLINTYNVIIKSPAILDKVKSELNLDRTVEDLNSQITVSSAKDSQVVEIIVQDSSPHVAARIANKTAEVFQTQISKIMNIDNVSVLSKAEVKGAVAPIKPQPLLNIAIAIVVGLMVGIGLSFLLEYLDNTLKTEQDIENILGLPVMGVITTIKDVPKATNVQRPDVTARVPQRGETLGS